jgi:hypothetical protein
MSGARVRIAVWAAGAMIALAGGGARAESIFALNLLGERFDTGDARSSALGGFVQIADDSLALLEYNPAMVAWSKRVSFGVAGYLTRDTRKSQDLKQAVNATKFSSFAFAFPLYRKRVSFSVGYRPRYDPDGDFSEPETTPQGQQYTNVFQRTGGLWAVPFTVAADFGRAGKLGAFYSIERGRIENRWTIDFTSTTNEDAGSLEEFRMRGNGFGVGAVVNPVPRVSLGLVYEGKIDYDVDVETRNTNASTNTVTASSATLPERWTASAAWRTGHRAVLYGGASICDFTHFKGIDFPASRLEQEKVYAVGLEYYAGTTPLRASFRWEQLPYTLPDGQKISKVAFATGTGLFLAGSRGKLDTTLQFGKTGSVSSNGYSDSFVRFLVSISGSEDWKRKRGDRY